jgi:hypothetical protein
LNQAEHLWCFFLWENLSLWHKDFSWWDVAGSTMKGHLTYFKPTTVCVNPMHKYFHSNT